MIQCETPSEEGENRPIGKSHIHCEEVEMVWLHKTKQSFHYQPTRYHLRDSHRVDYIIHKDSDNGRK